LQETDDRALLSRYPQRAADLRARQEAADALQGQASERARAAAAGAKAAREAMTKAEDEQAKAGRSVEAAESGLSTAKSTLVAARAGLAECEAQLSRAIGAEINVTLSPAAVMAAEAAAKVRVLPYCELRVTVTGLRGWLQIYTCPPPHPPTPHLPPTRGGGGEAASLFTPAVDACLCALSFNLTPHRERNCKTL
jgi:hypothetical protein